MRLTITLSHDRAAFERLRPEWEVLQETSTANSIYLTWDWVTLWWDHFGSKRDLWLLEARDPDGRLVGLGPMMRHTVRPVRGLSWRQIDFIGPPLPCEHMDFKTMPGFEEAVGRAFMEHLIAHRREWDVLSFALLPEHSPTLALLRAWPGIDWQESDLTAPVVALPGDWDTYAREMLSHGKRKDQKRVHRNINAVYADRWRWEANTDACEFESTLKTVMALHQAQWTAQGKPGAFAGPNEAFYHEVAQRFCERGWLLLSHVTIDEKIVGGVLGYIYRDRYYDFAGGVDVEYLDYQIGHLLTEAIIRHEFERGVREHDFLWGNEEYKYRWGAVNRHNYTLVWLASPRARLIQGLINALRGGWRLVKRAMPHETRRRIVKKILHHPGSGKAGSG